MKRFLLIAMLLGTTVPAEAGVWDVYTNVRQVREILVDSSHVYSATSGGLYINDFSSGHKVVRIYNSASGIGGHDLNALARAGNTAWMGGSAGILTAFDLQTEAVATFPLELGVSTIEALAVTTDTVWIGADIGLGLFLPKLNGGVLKEVYSHFGSLPADMAVRDVVLDDSTIWVVTEGGVAKANRGDPSLYLPTRWSVYTDPALDLASGRVGTQWRDSFYVGTDSGLAVFTGSGFASRFTDEPVRSLYSDNDTLWIGSAHGVFIANGDSVVKLTTQNLQSVPMDAIARRPGAELWAALPGNDLYYNVLGSVWFIRLELSQPAAGSFREVALADGLIWTALGGGGANYLDTFGEWQAVPDIIATPSAPTNGVTVAPSGVYFNGWGQGFHWVQPDGDSVLVVQYDATNTLLGATDGSVSYTVVSDIAVDPFGGRWVANKLADSGQVLVYFPPSGTPQSVFGEPDSLVDTRVNTLLLTDNLLWIGFDGGGLGVLDFNYTPLNHADDTYYHYNANDDRLPNDNVVALLQDRAGAVWVGTPGGLARVDVSVFPFLSLDFADLQPADGSVLSLEVDDGNNIWVGTVKGLARIPDGQFAPDSVWFVGETPLPDNQVNGLTFDETASVMWVATENGLGRLPLAPVEQVPGGELEVYPNPLVLRFDGDYATFSVPFGARVDIFNVAGDCVRTLDRVGAVNAGTRWDGRNDAGKLVASGLYIFRVTYLDGTTGRGRIGVVRQR